MAPTKIATETLTQQNGREPENSALHKLLEDQAVACYSVARPFHSETQDYKADREPTSGVALLSGVALVPLSKVVVAASAEVVYADSFHVGGAADPAHLAGTLQAVLFECSVSTHTCGGKRISEIDILVLCISCSCCVWLSTLSRLTAVVVEISPDCFHCFIIFLGARLGI